MPYVQWSFFTSEPGQAIFVAYAITLVVCHMQYVHSRVDIGRAFTLGELAADLVGLTWMWNLCTHDYPESHGLQIFLFVHFVVHLASLGWALLGWRSLDQHMREFRRRQGNALFNGLEWVYEQSDTSLYLFLAMRIVTRLPVGYALPLIILASFAAGSAPLKNWFGRSAASSETPIPPTTAPGNLPRTA